MARPRIKFTVNDYMTAPEDKRYELLDGELILAPSPIDKHQAISGELYSALRQFIMENSLGKIRYSPYDVVLSRHDVVQPDILFVFNERSGIIAGPNIRGAPDLVVEILSPSTARRDRGYKRALYSRHGVREYWLVDPDAETVEVLAESNEGLELVATYQRGETLSSPLLEGLAVDLEQIFAQ